MSDLLTNEVRQWIGREAFYAAPDEIGRAAIRLYAMAIGDHNPLYFDQEFARTTRYGGIVAPPTMTCDTNQYMTGPPAPDGYLGHVWNLPIPPSRLFRIGNEYHFLEPLRPDDHLRARWRLVHLEEHATRRGPMLFVVSHVDYSNESGTCLATNRETIAFQPLGEPRTIAGPGRENNHSPAEIRAGQPIPPLRQRVDLTAMIMYAAATWDFHRYHYDGRFAVEHGFPGTPIDGQMLGALLAKYVMAWAGPSAVLRELCYKIRDIVVPGDTITSRGKALDVRSQENRAIMVCELSVTNDQGADVIRDARATLEVHDAVLSQVDQSSAWRPQ